MTSAFIVICCSYMHCESEKYIIFEASLDWSHIQNNFETFILHYKQDFYIFDCLNQQFLTSFHFAQTQRKEEKETGTTKR